MPATVIVFENQVTSDSSSVDHSVGASHPQDPEEWMATDSETQNLIEPDKAGSEDINLNVAATLEDTNPSSDNQVEVIINVHALSSGSDSLKEDLQPESWPVPPTDQFIIESGESPSQLPQINTVAVGVEEQTVVNGASSELSLSADQEFEKGGHISDGAKEREGERDRRVESAEHTETGKPLNPQLHADGEKQTVDNGTPSELSLSADQKFEDRGHINDDRESESDGGANATECTEITEPPPPLNTICTQLNVEREGRFEEGGQFGDDIEETKHEGDRSNKSAPPDRASNGLPVTLNGREEEASSESLLSPDQDNAGNTSDTEGEENCDIEGEGNNGQEREKLQVMNHSLGPPSETDSSVLESNDPTEMAHSHDTDQFQEDTLLDSVLPDPAIDSLPSQEDVSDSKEQKEICANADPDKLPKVEAIASSINQIQVQQGYANEAAVDDTDASTSLPSAQQERNNSNPFDHEKEELCEEDTLTSDPKVVHPSTATPAALILPVMVPGKEATTHQVEYHTGDPSSVEEEFSQTNKDDFVATAKHVSDQEDHLEAREANGDKREDGSEAPAKKLKHIMDQEDIGDRLETEESNGDKEHDNKHKVKASAKESECIIDQEDIGDHLETRECSGDKGDDDFEASGKKLGEQEDIGEQLETKEVNRDEGWKDLKASAKDLEDHEEKGDHLETKKVIGDKREDSSDSGNAFNQSPDSLSVVNSDDINVDGHTDQSLGDITTEKHTPVHLGSTVNLEESPTSSSIKSTSRQSDDEVLPSKSPVSTESDLNMSLSSQEDVCKEEEEEEEEEAYNGSTDKGRPTDPLDESLSSQDDSCKEKEEVYNNSMEVENLKMFSGDIVSANQEGEHNNTEAQANVEGSASNDVSIESQKEVLVVSNSSNESYEDIAPIKCIFVGRTVKTVARTSVDSSIKSTTVHGENHIGSFSESPPPPLKSFDAEHSKKNSNEEIINTKTSMVVENGDDSPPNYKAILGTPIQESKFGSVNDEMQIKSLSEHKETNGTLTPLKGANSMEFTSQKREKAEASGLQTPQQKFPYKFETVV